MFKYIPAALLFVLLGIQLGAQQPAGTQDLKSYATSSIVTRMMAFNKKGDGKLTKEEVTDERLHRLFDSADADKDGVVTRDELMALAAKMDAEFGQDGGKGKGGKGDKSKGPKGEKGPGGKGDKG